MCGNVQSMRDVRRLGDLVAASRSRHALSVPPTSTVVHFMDECVRAHRLCRGRSRRRAISGRRSRSRGRRNGWRPVGLVPPRFVAGIGLIPAIAQFAHTGLCRVAPTHVHREALTDPRTIASDLFDDSGRIGRGRAMITLAFLVVLEGHGGRPSENAVSTAAAGRSGPASSTDRRAVGQAGRPARTASPMPPRRCAPRPPRDPRSTRQGVADRAG